MKRLNHILMIVLLAAALPKVCAQQATVEDQIIKIFNKYEERAGVESITISPTLFGLMKNGKTSDKKTEELLSKITGLRILTVTDGSDGKNRANREALATEIQTAVKTEFEEIMRVKSDGENLRLYVGQQQNTSCKDCKNALLLIASSPASITVMHLAGIIDKPMIDAVMNGEIGISNK